MAEASVSMEPLVEVVTTPPATPPAPAADDQKAKPAATDDTAETAAETTEQQEEKKRSKFQRRLDRQKAEKVAAQTEARLLREERDALRVKLDGKSAPQAESEPKREDFPDYETYLDAKTAWRVKQETSAALKTDREERQRGERQRQATAGQEKVAQDWVEREKTFQAATKDYETVVNPFVDEELGSYSEPARRAIVESEVGPQLLYHLASNPEVAERISDLSPLRQVAELGKLEATVAAPAPKKAPGAPPPLKPTPQGHSTSGGISESDSQQEYEQKRKAQGARWAR